MPQTPSPAPVLPFTTGSPFMDSAIRSAVIATSAFLTGAILVWLNKYGILTWLNANGFVGWLAGLGLSVPGLIATFVFTTLIAIAGAAWGWYAVHRAQFAVVEHVLEAARTQTVPPSIAAEALKMAAGK
jgi:hypothetical protein